MPRRSAAKAPDHRNPAPGRPEISCSGNTFITCVRLAPNFVKRVWSVEEAWSTGRMMRNMGVLLEGGLDARGRPQFTQQAHCLCNDGHALAAVRALEDLAEIDLPRGALLVRSLVQALRCIQEHLLHVYHFHLTDWVSLEAALRADPAATARLAMIEGQDAAHFRSAQDQLRELAQEQAAGGLHGAVSAHPAYKGADGLHLLLHAHGLESLHTGALLNAALDLLGCGPDGFKAYQLGGLPQDLNLSPAVRLELRGLLLECRKFVERIFLPDLERLARTYADLADLADLADVNSFLCCGDYALPHGPGRLFPGGATSLAREDRHGNGPWQVHPAQEPVHEEQEPQWSPWDRDRYRLNQGVAGPGFRWGQGEYHWLPAPRLGTEACEVGALARVLAAWAHGGGRVREVMDGSLARCGLSPAAMNSLLGRTLSRGMESVVLARAALDWLDELESCLGSGREPLRADITLPRSGLGTGRVEVPRGVLTHTIRLENGRIAAHDYLIPSLWNFSPRDSRGRRGPLEQALMGSSVADPDRPLELLRVVHALDPCNAGQLVIEDADSGRITVVAAK